MLQEDSIVTVTGLKGIVKYKPTSGYWVDFSNGNSWSHQYNCEAIANHFGFKKLTELLINKYPHLYKSQTMGTIFPYFENLHDLTLFIFYLTENKPQQNITIF